MTNVSVKRRLERLIKFIDERIKEIDKRLEDVKDISYIPGTAVGEQWGLNYAKGLIKGELDIIEIEEEVPEDD